MVRELNDSAPRKLLALAQFESACCGGRLAIGSAAAALPRLFDLSDTLTSAASKLENPAPSHAVVKQRRYDRRRAMLRSVASVLTGRHRAGEYELEADVVVKVAKDLLKVVRDVLSDVEAKAAAKQEKRT